jgi:hypothetical protein
MIAFVCCCRYRWNDYKKNRDILNELKTTSVLGHQSNGFAKLTECRKRVSRKQWRSACRLTVTRNQKSDRQPGGSGSANGTTFDSLVTAITCCIVISFAFAVYLTTLSVAPLPKGCHLDVVRGPSTPHDPESDAGGSLSSW